MLDTRPPPVHERAGIVRGYMHSCRRLWAKAASRHFRFHDTRNTTATLLLKAVLPLATVQKLLRHADPALTTGLYGHLDLEDMRAGINHLRFEAPGEPDNMVPLALPEAVRPKSPRLVGR